MVVGRYLVDGLMWAKVPVSVLKKKCMKNLDFILVLSNYWLSMTETDTHIHPFQSMLQTLFSVRAIERLSIIEYRDK
jgi:hypothetical protein